MNASLYDLLQKIQLAKLPYGSLITKILVVTGADTMGKSLNPIHSRVNYSLLSNIRVHIFKGHLSSESIDEDEVLGQPATTNGITFNTLLEITQQNALAI